MEELDSLPPPVPPKDTPDRRGSYLEHSSASVNKRKRFSHLADDSELDLDGDGHTPKRHRTSPSGDDSPRHQSTLRRKKGVNNLSSLNLRHEAERSRLEEPRESRFQEGSLTDKPSQRPPSMFINTSSLAMVDTLMGDYHNGMPTPDESVPDVDDTQVSSSSTEQTSALYRFGQKLATSFRPVALWNKLWNETKEELTQRNIEAEQKKQEKLEIERQYNLMKRAGHFPTKRTSFANLGSISQRDSGIVMTDGHSSQRSSVYGISHNAAASRTESSSRAGSHTGSEIDADRTLRGRLHFKRPSLNNLRWDLKRTRSEANLAVASADSSASISPVKIDDDHTIRRLPSKADLKKQHKLSKRVSDLEMKLHIARQELNDAMVETTPIPRPGRYERSSNARKFVPGLLPSLPSERLLDAEALAPGGAAQVFQDDTIRASRVNYPRRAADLFDEYDSDDDSIRDQAVTGATERKASIAIQNAGTVTADVLTQGEHECVVSQPLREEELAKNAPAIESDELQEQTDQETHVLETLADHERQLVINDGASARFSIDSSAHSLEPLYEEEEEIVNVPLNGDPTKPTATATPARFGRYTRSTSPVKHSIVRPGAEEIVITRAAEAAKQHPGRRANSRSPHRGDDYVWPDDVF